MAVDVHHRAAAAHLHQLVKLQHHGHPLAGAVIAADRGDGGAVGVVAVVAEGEGHVVVDNVNPLNWDRICPRSTIGVDIGEFYRIHNFKGACCILRSDGKRILCPLLHVLCLRRLQFWTPVVALIDSSDTGDLDTGRGWNNDLVIHRRYITIDGGIIETRVIAVALSHHQIQAVVCNEAFLIGLRIVKSLDQRFHRLNQYFLTQFNINALGIVQGHHVCCTEGSRSVISNAGGEIRQADIPHQGDGGGVAEAAAVLEDNAAGVGKLHHGGLIAVDRLAVYLDGAVVRTLGGDLHIELHIRQVRCGGIAQGLAGGGAVQGELISIGRARGIAQVDRYGIDVRTQQLRLEGGGKGNLPAAAEGEGLGANLAAAGIVQRQRKIQGDISALARQCGRVALEGDSAGLHLIEEAVEILHRFAGEGAVGEIGLLDSLELLLDLHNGFEIAQGNGRAVHIAHLGEVGGRILQERHDLVEGHVLAI